MKSFNMVSSHFAIAVSFLAFTHTVYCIDQVYQYQDASPTKKKLPLERLNEQSGIQVRYRRDALPLTNATIDDHKYYTSAYFPNRERDWFELSDHPERRIDHYLSNGNMKSKNYKLKFTFPYYGHPITNATVTTGGFLYVGYVATSLVTSVMYIAPFMAPFNPSLNESAVIYYFSNASQFTVQWTNLRLNDKEKVGPFTFQCTLYKDGRILFAYKLIPLQPLEVLHIKTLKHPVRVGISDAFYGYNTYYDRKNLKWFRVRIFYVYHKVNKTSQIISNGSTLLLKPIKNCIAAKSCGECVNMTKTTHFKCAWCSKLQRCSDSFDRHRVEWIQKSCYKTAIKEYKKCSAENESNKDIYAGTTKLSGISTGAIAAIVTVCVVVFIAVGLGAWCFYAYTHPVTPSGLFLIECRSKPAQLFKGSGGGTVNGVTASASRA